MSSIGPQLPPHLQKRKRTPEDDDAPGSPPSKTMRPANNDEIALDDDSSDDDYGPSTAPATQHGPALPSPTSKPTKSPTRPSIGPAMPPPPTTESRSTISPAPPPAPLSTRPSVNPEQASDSDTSDDDDDYGPALPTSAAHQSRLSALPSATSSASSAAAQPPKRDDWMLAPPSAPTSYRERDPTKLRARKFATGKAAAGNESHAGGVSAFWTETPEEKARRLRDAVLGRGGAEEQAAPRAAAAQAVVAAPRGEKADEDKIRSFTEQTRGRSLYEEHQLRKNKGKAEEGGKEKKKGDGEDEDDDPSKRAFSWEKDMKSSGTISHTQRRQLLAKSADFGGRFDKGRYL